MSIIQYKPQPPTFEGTFLRAGWIPKPVAGSVVDLSGNAKHGTQINGCAWEKDPYFGDILKTVSDPTGFSFPGTLSLANTATWAFWYKIPTLTLTSSGLATFASATSNDYMGLRYNGSAKLFSFIRYGATSRYIEDTQASRVDVWTLATFTYDGDKERVYCDGTLRQTSASWGGAIYWWNSGTAGIGYLTGASGYAFKCFYKSPFILNKCWSQDDVISYYNLAKTACWKTDYGPISSITSEGGIVGNYLSNTKFQFGDTTGRFYVETDSINGKLCKVIRCSTAGVIYIDKAHLQQEAGAMAFGEIEFWFYKPGAVSVSLTFNNTGTAGSIGNANEVYFASGEEVGIQRYAAGVWAANNFQTAASYCPISTWTKARITRTVAGIYNVFVNDNLVSPTATGTNPFTDTTYLTSETIRISMGAGSKISLGAIDGSHAIVKRLKA